MAFRAKRFSFTQKRDTFDFEHLFSL